MTSFDKEATANSAPHSFFLRRSSEIIQALPLEYRWEFTRRHPYYLWFWEAAARHRNHPSDDPTRRLADEAAILILQAINVADSMTPLDPRLGPEALGTNDLGGAWKGGAVAPAMFRTLAQMLLLALPKSQRMQLSRLLSESAEYDSQNAHQIYSIASRLSQLSDPVWDSYPNVPVVSINLQAPQRAITKAIVQLVGEWKEERGIPEHRRRDDKLEEYLRVWDLREGWADGNYDPSREKTFKVIAHETATPLSTVISRYRTAFHYLSGYTFTRELFIRLMGPLKYSRYADGDKEGLLSRRPWRSPNLRPVAEGILVPHQADEESPRFLEVAGIADSQIALVDLALDIESLLAQGLSEQAIIERLELTVPSLPSLKDFVAEILQRHEDR